jgi:hypothetical protein
VSDSPLSSFLVAAFAIIALERHPRPPDRTKPNRTNRHRPSRFSHRECRAERGCLCPLCPLPGHILEDSPRFPDAGVFQTAQIYSRTSKPLRSGSPFTYEKGPRFPSQRDDFGPPSSRAHDP